MPAKKTTIAALASGPVSAALAIVRISGKRAWPCAAACLDKKEKFTLAAPGRLGLYFFKMRDSTAVIDQVMAVKHKAPRSFSGEDMVEIFCHGSLLITEKILRQLFLNGCVPAKRGEFSQRAFANDKISLLQAEAINGLISSRSESSLKNATFQYQGGYLPVINQWKQTIKDVLVVLEGALEFPEEEDHYLKRQTKDIFNKINALRDDVIKETEKRTKIKHIDNNFSIAIVGVPNVGKSSLFNALLQFERSIVHPTSGTTRDTISETIYIDNIPITLIDTAGLNNSRNGVEKIGIKRAFSAINKADMIIFMTAANQKTSAYETGILNDLIKAQKEIIGIINKTDLCSAKKKVVLFYNNSIPYIAASLHKSGQNKQVFNFIETSIKKRARSDFVPSIFQNMRHEQIARDLLQELCAALKKGTGEEVLAHHLKRALELIAEFLGTTTSEEILESIFNKFCIGK